MPDRAKTKIQERRFDFQVRAAEAPAGEQPELWAEGYATRFESPTTLYEGQSYVITEQIMRGSFDSCNMTDVIFNYNHGGKVMARTRNKTLQLAVDNDGLFIRARLDGTEEGRKLYDEIKGGYIDRMSFRFSVEEEKRIETDGAKGLQIEYQISKVKKLYDVSAVDIPAYDDTSIEARRVTAEEILEERERMAAEAAAALELTRARAKILRLTLRGE